MGWLDELKENSVVIVIDNSWKDYEKSIGKVLRTTATKVFLESGKTYNRKNGAISPHRYGYLIEEATPEAVQRVKEARHEHELFLRVSSFFDTRKKVLGLSVSQLEGISKILEENDENS